MTNNNIIEGKIFSALFKLSMPIMATSLMQTLYNIMDMFWVGKLGSTAVASVGTGGFFIWLAFAFILLISIGAQVGVAQSVGRGDQKAVKKYSKTSLQLSIIFGIMYSIVLVVFHKQLIFVFGLNDKELIHMAYDYLVTYGYGAFIMFIISVYKSIWSGYGNSKLPFISLGVGILANLVLDPLFILSFGMGVKGAALATILSQGIALMVFIVTMPMSKELFSDINILKGFDREIARDIIKVGVPTALQSFMFTSIAVVITRIIAFWGPVAIAVQRLGAQLESITWMSADGISLATNTFVAQNYGAKKEERIKRGYFIALAFASSIGFIAGFALIFFGREIFSIFIKEKEAIEIGTSYAKIIGISEVFMSIEAISGGAFSGFKLTKYPSTVSIVFNLLRIPGALILSSFAVLGLSGVWWSISLSSVFKGTVLTLLFIRYMKKMKLLGRSS